MKVLEYIMCLVWTLILGAAWTCYILGELIPLWYAIMITVWVIVRLFVGYFEITEGRNDRVECL